MTYCRSVSSSVHRSAPLMILTELSQRHRAPQRSLTLCRAQKYRARTVLSIAPAAPRQYRGISHTQRAPMNGKSEVIAESPRNVGAAQEDVRRTLERVLASEMFSASPKLAAFLRFVVE